ncbi:uncharacterized protein LOC130789780 [Actinidia eriantha]|uniref:uncharacterized protein LOC130789780 n=1 Tax=Actinidia eriantha TaxID=165200 RepID=UPI00258E3B2A|nr:uncharacterized protein LOC130789780 [Actinidia eriantha]
MSPCSQRKHLLTWLHPFVLLSLFTISSATSQTSSSSLSYSDHCSLIVPESSPTVPDNSIFPYLITHISHYTGGQRILGSFSSESFYNSRNYASLSFHPSQQVYKTNTSGVYKIQAFLVFQASTMYFVPNGSTSGKPSYSRSPRKINSLQFVLNGFYSHDSGKLCMVGSASWQSKEGKFPIHLDAVLELSCSMNTTITTSLITGKLESLSSPNASNYFEPISILAISMYANYKYTLVLEELDRGFPGGIDLPQNQSLGLEPRRFCAMYSRKNFELEYTNACTSLQNCSPLGEGINFLPSVMSLNDLRCSSGDEHEGQYLVEFGNHSYFWYYQPFDPTTSLIAEGSWDGNKNRLCIVACRILNSTNDLGNARASDCSIRLSLTFPAFWSIRNRNSIVGQIWTNKTVNDSGYFDRITFAGNDYNMVGVLGLRYEYTQTERARNSCPAKNRVKWKRERYPRGDSYDMRFDMSVKDFVGKRAWGYAVPIFVGNQTYEQSLSRSWDGKSEVEARTSVSGPKNISYRIIIAKLGPSISGFRNSSTNLSFIPNEKVEISAEGVYDYETGLLCMIGCRNLDPEFHKSMNDSMDCELLLKFQFPPVNAKRGGLVKGSIESIRDKTDPLYFESLSMSSVCFLSFGSEKIHLADGFGDRHGSVLPFMSLVMLVILTLGNMILLVLNYEAVFLGNRNGQTNVLLGSGGWLEVNEVIVRVVTMVAFLLEFRLLQLAWSARFGDDNYQKGLWDAERKTLFVSLPLYLVVVLISLIMNQQHSLWRALRSCGGLVVDGFLFPQILLNIFRFSRENVLSHWFYIGTTFVRLLPHAYDLYRAQNFARDGSYFYAVPSADFYSPVWDVIIPCGGVLLAGVIFLQQRFGGRCFLLRRFREAEVYEKLPVESSIPALFFFIVFVIKHCYQRLRHDSGLDPELPDLEAGQDRLARPPSPSTTAADHRRVRNKTQAQRLVLPVDREYKGSTTNIPECAICLEEFRDGETCRVLLVCDHFFHPECIGLWLVENRTCPICRREVFWQSD